MFWEKLLADLPFYLINLAAFATVILVTWLWARTRFVAELAQYQVQIANLQAQRSDQLYVLEDSCKEKYERLRLINKDFNTQIRIGNAEMAKARRNELSNVFMLDYLPAMAKYVRLADEVYASNKDLRRQFIENHIFPFLSLVVDIMYEVNIPKVKQLLGEETLDIRFRYMDLDFAFDFVRSKNRWSDLSLRIALNKYVKQLGFQKDIKLYN